MKRIYHRWEKWECYPAGFYENHPPKGMNREDCEEEYRLFLSNLDLFGMYLGRVINEWVNSCEHYLTNEKMNRIAWMGQASLCLYKKIPSKFRGGFNLLTDDEKEKADNLALKYINKWMSTNGYEELTRETIKSKSVADLY
jgi:hypothetical protein